MEDMSWVLYALLGTQVILIFSIWRIGVAVRGDIISEHRTLVTVLKDLRVQTGILENVPRDIKECVQSSRHNYEELRSQTSELAAISMLLENHLPGGLLYRGSEDL